MYGIKIHFSVPLKLQMQPTPDVDTKMDMCAFLISSVCSPNAPHPNVLSANINMRHWVYSHLSLVPSKKRRLFVRKTC